MHLPSAEVLWTSIHATTATSATHATAIGTSAIGITMTTGCRLDVARVLRPSPITNVNATTVGTTHVTALTIAIVRMPVGLSAIAIRGTVAPIRVRCLPVASTCLVVVTGKWSTTPVTANTHFGVLRVGPWRRSELFALCRPAISETVTIDRRIHVTATFDICANRVSSRRFASLAIVNRRWC